MNKERIAIYPFSNECNVFSDYYDMIDEKYILKEVASPLVWGMTGKIIKTSEGEIVIRKSPDEFTEEIDTLLIPDFYVGRLAEKSLIKEITEYMKNINKILYYGDFSSEGKLQLVENANRFNVDFIDLRDYSDYTNINYDNRIEECPVPVVAISGVWENTDKFETALSISKSLKKQGYNVLQIGSRGYAELFGALPFPSFMFNTAVSEYDKPKMFSKYLKELAEKTNPDIIIVCIPGAMQKLNDDFPDGSGILQYITFQALTPDYVVVCSLYEENPDLYNNLVKNLFYYRYGTGLDAIHISNTYFDLLTTSELGEVKTLTADDQMVKETLNKSDNCEALITNVTLPEQSDKIAEDIIRKLSSENVSL